MSNNTDVVVVATLIPRAGKEAALEEALRAAVRGAHQEHGCRRYALHRTIRGGEGLVVIEHWDSADALAAHGKGEPFTSLAAQFEDLLAEPLRATVLASLPEGDPTLGRL
ncbi:Putative monooxygenase (plasmid) [Rhodococcus ruber]|uniref:putative quinol monooxygenase n=1 Tax=Rhodococcus ruber TaxID=1830 RepID=UPI00315DDBDF